jgi:chromosome segregation ATPase
MANSLDSVTAATKLRRDMMEVQKELDDKRADYQKRMEKVKEGEEQLKVERAKLQDTLVQYYKFIQENEIKRNRANKKASAEEKAKQDRHTQIVDLTEELHDLEKQKELSRSKYLQYVKYQKYLEEVLQHGDNEEYQDPKDIISRFQTLDDNTRVLQRRKTQLEEDLNKNKNMLNVKRQRKKNDSVELQNQLNELQTVLENLQKEYKIKQDQLEQSINHKGTTTKTIGQVRMACQNLYDRCIEWNVAYRSRAHDVGDSDILQQLSVIGDCLDDYSVIIKKHNEKMKLSTANAASGAAAGQTQEK